MRKMQHIRTAIAVLLLSVVLPITLVLPFHHHEIEEAALESCGLCATHQSHPGHLVAAKRIPSKPIYPRPSVLILLNRPVKAGVLVLLFNP